MSGVTVKVILKDIKKLPADALIVGFYEDVRPLKGIAGELDWLLCGSLSLLLLSKKLRGSLGDLALVTSQGKVPVQKIFMVGLGSRSGMTQTTLKSAARNAATCAVGAGVRSAAIEYFPSSDMQHDAGVSAMYHGLNEGAGGRDLDVLLMASDASAYEHIVRSLKETPVTAGN
jgi:Cytosol aminopeptidase family, N-terminal domain